jgi:hypothetical protein
VTDNVVVSLLASALLGSPELDNGRQTGVHANIGDRRLAAEEGGAGREVGVERGQTLSGLRRVLGGRSDVGGSDEPLLDLGLFRLGVLDVRVGDGRELVRVVAGVLGLRVGGGDQVLDLVVDVDGSHGGVCPRGVYRCSVEVLSGCNASPMGGR